MVPEEAMMILDAGHAYNHGQPPATIAMAARSGGFWRDARLKGGLEDLGQHYGDAEYAG
jgi:hypothetical protein